MVFKKIVQCSLFVFLFTNLSFGSTAEKRDQDKALRLKIRATWQQYFSDQEEDIFAWERLKAAEELAWNKYRETHQDMLNVFHARVVRPAEQALGQFNQEHPNLEPDLVCPKFMKKRTLGFAVIAAHDEYSARSKGEVLQREVDFFRARAALCEFENERQHEVTDFLESVLANSENT